jgi:hypothetical protein
MMRHHEFLMDVDLELEMKISRRKLLVLLLYEFRLGRNATEVIG